MARQYSAKTFLRQVPNDLLKRYFDSRGIDLKLEWVRLDEVDVDWIFLSMEKLDESVRSRVDGDFRAINDLCSEAGNLALIEEATARGKDWTATFAGMRNAYERAFWTFLEDPDCFRMAGNFHEMDRRTGWRRRFVGRGLEADTGDLAPFQKRLRLVYRRQGRGRFCHVDYYERRNPVRHCYFAYPEDYASTDVGYDDHGRFQQRARRSAFEIIFVYRPEEGVLEVCAKGDKRLLTELEIVFCQYVLGLEEVPEKGCVPFDLTVLKDGDFPFLTDPADQVSGVYVRQLRLDLPEDDRRRIIVMAQSSERAPRALHDLLEQAINQASMPLASLRVSQAKLQFVFSPCDGQRAKTLTFEVTCPDRCTLKDDPLDQIARKYLREWGIIRA